MNSETTAQEETEAPGEQREDAWSPAKLMDSEMKDPNLRPVIEWIETSETVSESESMLRFSDETKELWLQKDLLTLVDGVFYWKGITGIGSVRWIQLIVPRNLRKDIIQLLHAGAAGT